MGNLINKGKGKGEAKENQEAVKTNLGNRVISKSTTALTTTELPRRRKVLRIGKISVSIIQGKITEEKADVIVNSVDYDLVLSKGRSSNAIAEEGGSSIQSECQSKYPSGISEDEVAITGGGNLNCKNIYHITLPKWDDSNKEALKSAMKNCLETASQNRMVSLVFPPFGSGYLGYPVDVLSNSILDGVVDFERSNKSTSIKSVVVVCYRSQGEVFRAFERKARELSGVASQPISHSSKCGNINVTIQRGSLTKQRCDVMVVTASKDLKLKNGIVSKSVLEAAGDDIQNACDNNYPNGIDNGEIASTRGYKLPCRFVYFVSLPTWNASSNTSQQALTEVITNCLEKAHSHDVKYLAFPTLGTGSLKYPPHILAKTMKTCIETFDTMNNNSKLRNIYIVVFNKSRDYLEIEKALLKEFSVTPDFNEVRPSAPAEPIQPSAPPMSPPPGTPQFHMWMYRYDDKPPSYWSIYGPSKLLKDWSLAQGRKKYELVNASESIKDAVTKIVEETWLPKYVGKGRDAYGLDSLNYSRVKVTQVQRIENPELFEKYTNFRGTLFRKAGIFEKAFDKLEDIPTGMKHESIYTTQKADTNVLTDFYPEINEHYLFHGTREDRIDIIATQGFDVTRADKAMFGAAIYAAESSTKSDQYADDKGARDKNNPKKMFLLRMALGETFVTEKEQKFSRPPCKTCSNDRCIDPAHNPDGHGFYDSVVVDGQWNFREFMAFNSGQCYPEYVITYMRV